MNSMHSIRRFRALPVAFMRKAWHRAPRGLESQY
jgi:hypothetical protein